MALITPDEIAAKAENAYPKFLKAWIRGDGEAFFPYRVRVKLAIDPKNPRQTIRASEALVAASKQVRGWGYTLHREYVRTRDFGNNPLPTAITIDSREDLLRLADRQEIFDAIEQVAKRIRAELPQLEEWLVSAVRFLLGIAIPIDGLIEVAKYFLRHPWPDCYARQLPVSVDTKFIDRHETILRQWLDILLPPSAIDVNEPGFARRFGLRDGQPHRAVRILDPRLCPELGLPFDELSLPLRLMATLAVRDSTIVIVENNLSLLTLPSLPRGLGIRGEGNSVTRLERLTWLHDNRVLYWGDIDLEGFAILARLRRLFPHVESILMDLPTLEAHRRFAVPGNASTIEVPSNLTPAEAAAFVLCARLNLRLEQEKLPQPYVDATFARLAGGQ